MPETTHTARLYVGAGRGGVELTNFDELDCTIDMLAPGSPFTVTFWHSDGAVRAENAWRNVKSLCKVEETVRLTLDDAEQLHGRIERVTTKTSRDGRTLTVSGRDFAARALDWDADPTISLKGKKLGEALELLFRDVYAVPVVLVSGAEQSEVQSRPQRQRRTRTTHRPRRTKKVDAFKINAGDRIWQLADQLCRRNGYLLWCAPVSEQTAGLVVDVPASTGPTLYTFERRQLPGGVLGGNILDSTLDYNGADVPTVVTSFAESPLDSNDDAHGRAAIANTRYTQHPMVAHDGTLSGSLIPKPRYIKPRRVRTLEDAQKAADRVVAEAMADFEVIELTVRGWGQNGRLYAVNTLARVRDDTEVPVLDGVYLVTRVSFRRSRAGGTTTTLRLVPAGAIQVFPAEAA
ncbi:MAG: hypothetical protein EKK55_10230 [Rhodocyclaceae bacterium]|nr:MAG: hypothetical protein EKK55_10230 [Rhodocyclaceae bacterium]